MHKGGAHLRPPEAERSSLVGHSPISSWVSAPKGTLIMTLQASYVARAGSPLTADPALYGPIGRETSGRTLVRSEVIPVRSGRAWTAPAGRVLRFSIVEGPQVLDLNLRNPHDPRERFWAARTRQFYGAHVTTGHRLWSTLPFLRPLATIVADSLAYGRDADGAGCHDLL